MGVGKSRNTIRGEGGEINVHYEKILFTREGIFQLEKSCPNIWYLVLNIKVTI